MSNWTVPNILYPVIKFPPPEGSDGLIAKILADGAEEHLKAICDLCGVNYHDVVSDSQGEAWVSIVKFNKRLAEIAND